MEDMELIFSLTVGQLREALAYADTDELVEDALEDIDFGLYIEDGYLNGTPAYDDEEDPDEDDLWEDDEDEDYDDEDYDDEEEEEEEPYAAQPLPLRMQEDLAIRIAKDVLRGAYSLETVQGLYGDQVQLFERICYLVDFGGVF